MSTTTIEQDTMMVDRTKSVVIKIFSYESTDVDEDGTRFLRGIVLRKGCSRIDEFKLRCEDYDDFIRTQQNCQNNRFRILSEDEEDDDSDDDC